MNPFSSGTRLRDMIRAIRACKTAAEERAVVRKECAAIRAAVSENDSDYRHRNLAKLMFVHMLGYPTHFGQMECLKLIASSGFPEKRIGYLGLMLLLDEKQEVLMLVTNSLKQDLNHSNQYIVGLALCALANICSAEMARDLAPEVEKLLQSREQNIRKKAALCSIRIIRKVPDLAENFESHAASLLKEKHHGALIAGVQLCTELCKASNEALDHLRKCTEGLVRVLKDTVNSPYAPEYDIAGITDPFLQIRLLKLLRVLGHGDADSSDYMSDILAQVAAKTESHKNAGNAILYECVATIMGIEANSGLRVLAINILGRFLSNRDNNIRYVALNMLMKAVSVDTHAVQRHRTTILECVKDSDASIKKRALELLSLLVNEKNVKPLIKELVDYLEVSDSEFKGDLAAKICSIVEKFSTDKLWYINQMLKVLSEAGNLVKMEVWYALIVVISNASNLHGYTVRCLYRALCMSYDQEPLVRVAVWCIGEYGEMLVHNLAFIDEEEQMTVTESDAISTVEAALKHHSSDVTTRAMSLISLLKLSSRFPSCSKRIKETIVQQRGNLFLELQQRSIEFGSIIEKHENIRPVLLDHMPVLDEATFYTRKMGSTRTDVPSERVLRSSSEAVANLPNGIVKSAASAPLIDLLDSPANDSMAPNSSGGDILNDLLGVGSTPHIQISGARRQGDGADFLLDLLSIGTSPVKDNQSSSVHESGPASSPLDALIMASSQHSPEVVLGKTDSNMQTKKSPRESLQMIDLLGELSASPTIGDNIYPSIVAFQSDNLKILFSFSKQPGKPEVTDIEATFLNMTSFVYKDFVFQAAVPKFMQLHMEPASNNFLPAKDGGMIKQALTVTNKQHSQKALAMRIRVAYKVNDKDVLEQGQIYNFPAGL